MSARKGLTILAFLTPAVVFVGAFTYLPLFEGAGIAFRHWNLNDITNTAWVGLANFESIFAPDSLFWPALRNSVLWVFGSLIPQFIIGFAIALWLRRRFPLRGLYQAFVFFPWAISGFLIGLLFRWMFNGEFGVINDLLEKLHIITTPIPWLANPSTAMITVIIANVWYGVTFFAIMILAALQSVPEELYESATLDGAGKARTLFSVTIPFVRATLLLTVLLRVIWIFNFPDIIFGMTQGGPGGATQIATSYMVTLTMEGRYDLASAVGLIVVAILLIFTIFYLLATRRRDAVS